MSWFIPGPYFAVEQRTSLWEYDNIREVYEACVQGLGMEVVQDVVFFP